MDFELIDRVAQKMEEAAGFVGGTATVGFDGFTDSIVRVVRGLAGDRSPLHFRSKREFGEMIIDLGPHNSSFDLTAVATKIGGNAPNSAHALGRLGIPVNCVGMLGRPEIHGLFRAMDPNCTLHSFADPAQTTALEFDDGKVLLAESEMIRTLDWPMVRDRIGLEKLASLYRTSDVLGFANWGEIEHASDIWEGIEREVLPQADPERRRIVFFDLADPTKRDRDIDRLLALIARLSANHETILCLNRNEALAIARHCAVAPTTDLEVLGAGIYAALSVDTLVVRDPRVAMAWTAKGYSSIATFYSPSPRLSTGGGDNFNAGYCFARLIGLDTRASLAVAAAVAGFYVTTGNSPTRDDVIAFLREKAASRQTWEAAQ